MYPINRFTDCADSTWEGYKRNCYISEFESYPSLLKPSLRKAGSGRVCPISLFTYFIEIAPKVMGSSVFRPFFDS
jgi:hypothetical protein